MPMGRMAPIVTLDAKFFWKEACNEKLVAEKCSDCGEFRFPPRPMCPSCHSVNREPTQLSGKARVVSWIKPVHPPSFGFTEPPTAAIVELEEGFRMVTNIVDIPFEDVKAGMEVEVTFADTMKDKKVPVFRPTGA